MRRNLALLKTAVCLSLIIAPFAGTAALAAAPVKAGLGVVDITPDVDAKKVWIAGYGQNRPATGVHDPLYARAVVLADGEQTIALVEVDLVGLQYTEVRRIREKLPELDYVMVASTHNHEGPDVIGLWGPSPFQSGVNPAYLDLVVERSAEAVREAAKNLVPIRAVYGTAQDDTLLRDSRLPHVPDGILRVVRLNHAESSEPAGIIVQWSCHPEAMGSKNTLITADFPHATIAALEKKYNCPVMFIAGAVGGLMTTPRERITNGAGEYLEEGTFEYTDRYGQEVADLTIEALDSATPITLAPIKVASREVAVPMGNLLYQAAGMMGVLKRTGYEWTGDFEKLGPELTPKTADKQGALVTEVAYLRLGDLHVACIPGEIYPELIYGTYQEPVEPNVDYPDAPLEPSLVEILPGDKFLIIGLANDEVGYIIPKRQWDEKPPFAYGRDKSQYGEENSVGVETAPILMEALRRVVREAQQ